MKRNSQYADSLKNDRVVQSLTPILRRSHYAEPDFPRYLEVTCYLLDLVDNETFLSFLHASDCKSAKLQCTNIDALSEDLHAPASVVDRVLIRQP